MANIFTLDDSPDLSDKINIDELYEKKRQLDINKLELFKKILNRVHVRIKTASNKYNAEKCCWYIVPELIIGVPRYDQAGCIAYIMHALEENGFQVKYFHPNTIFISWDAWVPSYIRSEIKKKTGIVVNEKGEKLEDEVDEIIEQSLPIEDIQTNSNGKQYTPITSYKPSGKFVYSDDMIKKMEHKIH